MKKKSFFIIFFFLFSLAFARLAKHTNSSQSYEELKQHDMERALKYEILKNTGGSGPMNRTLPRALPPDADDDGMPDSWETANGLNPNDPDDAWLDPDNDKVVNLFEYQLGSGTNNPATPPVATVALSGANYTNVSTAINSVAPGTAIRIAGGTYAVNYMTFDLKVVMIQGGWSPNFSERDLRKYRTTFDGGMNDEILYFSVYSGNPVIILDGIDFAKGNGSFGAVNFLAQGSAVMKTSILNCRIIQSSATASFESVLSMHNWDTSQSDRTIANTLIAGNAASGIYSQITKDTIAHWRIIEMAISDNKNGGGDNGYGIEAFTLDNGNLTAHIYDSILWGNEENDIEIRRNITFDLDHSDLGKGNAQYGAAIKNGSGVLSIDPKFGDPGNGNFHLQSSSPVIDKGISKGIPLIDLDGYPRNFGLAPDLGPYEYQGPILKADLLGTWDGQGVYYRNSDTGTWTLLASPADLIACGDLYGDGKDDLIGIWAGQAGVWTRNSANGSWTYLSSTARHIAAGDMNGDGRPDFLATWDGQGVYYKDSTSGAWTLMASPATLITAGDLDGDTKADLIGIWPTQSGVWVKYSLTGNWGFLGSSARDMTAGDMNGDGRVDLVGTWDGQGVFFRDSISGQWTQMASPADQITAGDLDGDGTDDLIGIWSGQAGIWVKYSQTQTWAYIGSSARDIAAGKMSGGAWSSGTNKMVTLQAPMGGFGEGPDGLSKYIDLSAEGPGGSRFVYQAEKNLIPAVAKPDITRIPGPGEAGFRWIEQKNLWPHEGSSQDKDKRKK